MGTRIIKLAGLTVVAIGVVIQWSMVGERLYAAAWHWYKFKNYGGGGQIIVGRYTQMMFYVLTVALIGIAGLIFRTDKGSWQARVARYECGALLIALVAWSIVLASSLVVFR